MDKIVFLVNFKPWNGHGDKKFIEDTYSTILNIFDPDKKIEIISRYWETEADQRNFGLDHLHKNNISWCFIIDDDEMYNFNDLKTAIYDKIYSSTSVVFLSPHQIYWKTRNFCIDKIALALPAFCRTDRTLLYFNEARAIMVNGGNTWHTFQPTELVCHHFSYIRNDDQMARKIQNFSHADPSLKDWYRDIWLKWELNSENLHPNRDSRDSFKKAISALESQYKLEPITVDKTFEKSLQAIRITSPDYLHWLRHPLDSPTVDFLHAFVMKDLKEKLRYKVHAPGPCVEFYAVCEAILKSGLQDNCTVVHKSNPIDSTKVYKFCEQGEIDYNTIYDIVFWFGFDPTLPMPKTRFMITAVDIPAKHTFRFGSSGTYFKVL